MIPTGLAEIALHVAVRYVAAAYIVFFALILLYLAIMAGKLSRIERELGELTELAARAGRSAAREEQDTP
jgi:CcmD family protein